MKVSVYIIAYNESEKITDCINSVLWADEIIVADSHSTDGTSEIAENLGAKVIHIDFDGYGKLRNEAISHCTGDWIFSLDSDERCTIEVRDEIIEIIENPDYDIYRVPRKNFFMGKWIKYSGWYPNFRQPQLFRNGKMTYDLKPVHEGYVSHSSKSIGSLRNAIWQFPFRNMAELMHKANRYSTLGAQKLTEKGKRGSLFVALIHATWSFVKHYILKLGFLDGSAGFVIAFGNFEGTFYRYMKLQEIQSNQNPPKVTPIKSIN